jgi:serine/threonine protein kinase
VVAVKFATVKDPVQLMQELETLQVLNELPHSHVATMLASTVICQPAPQAVFILDYAADDMHELINRRALLPALAVKCAPQAAHGLSHLHSLGILHCNLKPANLLVTFTNEGYPVIRIADFGMASVFDADSMSHPMTAGIDAQLH